MSRLPVLEVLQAGNAAAPRKAVKNTANPDILDTGRGMTAESGNGYSRVAYTQKGYKSLHSYSTSVWYVINNIVRAPLKPALTVAVAIIFVVTLGWMNLLIERNSVEIERLYSIANIEYEAKRHE